MDQQPFENILIRRAVEGDIPVIHKLWLEMMNYHKNFDPRFTLLPRAPEMFKNYCSNLLNHPDYNVMVAEDHEEIIGYVIAAIFDNPEIFILNRYGFIAEMAVTKDYRSKGVGKKLWAKAQKWFRKEGINVVQLNVSSDNHPGIKFWETVGFKPFLHILWNDLSQIDDPEDTQ